MKKNGFTLAELLGVIAILAVLVVVASINVVNFIKESADQTRQISIKNLEDSAVSYAIDQLFIPNSCAIDYEVTVDNPIELPSGCEKVEVTVGFLIDNGYFKDSSSNFNKDDTVLIYKYKRKKDTEECSTKTTDDCYHFDTRAFAGNLSFGIPSNPNAGKHEIAVNTDGGTASVSTIMTTVGQKIGTLPTVSKSGLTFLGWYSDNKFENEVTSDTIVTEELTGIYAKYEYAYASLIKGADIRDTFRILSGQTKNEYGYYYNNTTITSIQRSNTLKDESTKISTDDSENDVYVWYENGVIYYYSNAGKLLLNADSKGTFSGFDSLTNIDITDFDTSNVIDMSGLFSGFKGSTIDVSGFNTSKVTDMSYIFQNTKLDSLDVSSWDTSSVTTMKGMFMSAENLENLDLSSWNTSNVTTMEYMFQASKIKNLNLNNWNTSNVKTMYMMFERMPNLSSLNLSTFTNDSLETCEQMFYQVQGLKEVDLSGWHTSKLKNAYYMFGNSSVEKINISNWDFSSYRNENPFYDMFSYNKNREMKELIARNTTNVKGSFTNAFYGDEKLEKIDLTGLDTSQSTNMSNMFYQCRKLTQIIGIENFNTSNVTNMSYMFAYMDSIKNLNLSSFDTHNVTNMSDMFMDSKAIEKLDLSSFDTSNVTNMASIFSGLTSIKTIYVGDKWSTAKVSSTSIFYNVSNLVGGLGTTFDSSKWSEAYAHADGGTTNPGYLTRVFTVNGKKYYSDTAIKYDWSNASDKSQMAYYFDDANQDYIADDGLLILSGTGLPKAYTNTSNVPWYSIKNNIKSVVFKDCTTPANGSLAYLFYNHSNLKNVDISGLNSVNVKSIKGIFQECTSLEELDLRTFDFTSVVKDGRNDVIYGCNALTHLMMPPYPSSKSWIIYFVIVNANAGNDNEKYKHMFDWNNNDKEYAIGYGNQKASWVLGTGATYFDLHTTKKTS